MTVAILACAATPDLAFDDAGAPSGDAGDAFRDGSVDAFTGALPPGDASGDASKDTGADATCTLTRSTSVPACDTCLAASCCEAGNACLADGECLAIFQCVRSCVAGGGPVGTCRVSCRDQHPSGTRTFDPVAVCVNASCKSACV